LGGQLKADFEAFGYVELVTSGMLVQPPDDRSFTVLLISPDGSKSFQHSSPIKP
jgi:hypothetical protein